MKTWALVGGIVLTIGRVTTAGAEPGRRLELSASLLAGVGVSGRFQDSTQVHYGLGYGGRAGVTLPARLYVGAPSCTFVALTADPTTFTPTLSTLSSATNFACCGT